MRLRLGMRSAMVGVVVVALFAALVATALRSARNQITVENHSGVSVKSLTITVGRQCIAFGFIPSGGRATAAFKIDGDANFAVTGELADGSPLAGDFGYVTNGEYGVNARFYIEPGGKLRFAD